MDFYLRIIGITGLVSLIILSLLKPSKFIYYLLIIKPFIDLTVNQEFFGYNALALSGIYVFIFCVIFLIQKNKISFFNMIPITLYLLFQLFSIFNGWLNYNKELINMLELFIKMADSFLIYFIAVKYMSYEKQRLELYKTIWVVLNLLGFIYLFSYFSGVSTTDETKGVMRYGGFYNDPGTPSYQAVISLIFGVLYMAIKKNNKIKLTIFEKINIVITLFLLISIFALTITKSAILMLVVFIILWWGFYKRKTLIVIPLLVLGFYLIYTEYTDVSTRFNEEVEYISKDDVNATEINSLGTGRVGRWISLWDMFVYDYSFKEKLIGTSDIYKAHNQYLAILLQAGIIGLFFFILLLLRFLFRMYKFYKRTKQIDYYFGYMILLIFMIYSLTGHPFYYTTLLWYLMILLSLINKPKQISLISNV